MPVKIWDRMTDGALTSRVETSRSQSFRGERYRADADALDEEIDRMLDHAVNLSTCAHATEAGQQPFVKRWSIGRALVESKLLESNYLEASEQKVAVAVGSQKVQTGRPVRRKQGRKLARADTTPRLRSRKN